METGTFTIVDECVFYPSSKFKDKLQDKNDESSSTEQSDDDSDDTDSSQKSAKANKIKGHRKEVRRKDASVERDDDVNKEKNIVTESESEDESSSDSENSSDAKEGDKKNDSEVENFNNVDIKTEPETHNEFEFCGTIDEEAEVKEEVFSGDENNLEYKNDFNKVEKSGEESDDDVPLSALDKFNVGKQEKHSYDDSDTDTKKVKKLKITKSDDNLKVEYKLEVVFCAKCNKFCKSRKKYRSHLRKVHGKRFTCKFCTVSYDNQETLDDHYNTHTGNRPYCCYLCENETFKTEQSLKYHMKKYHTGKPSEKKEFYCHICGKALLSASSLDDHLRVHTGEKTQTCNICDKTFTRYSDLKQHQNVHEELWKCKFCNKCFTTPYKLKEHTRKHTGETPYECDKCDRRFARAGDFRYHVGTHLGLKPYNCEECGMRFTTSSNVTRHRLNTHQDGPRELACPHCPKLFHTETRLNSHIKNHENKNKFKCELCPVMRNSLAELNKHVLIHSGEFRCDTCHRGFTSAERLASHAARHDIAGKPYACFVCSIGYRSSQSLNKHLSTVHRNEDIPKIAPQHLCTLCGQVFEMKDKLNRHLKENHIVIVVGEIHAIEEDSIDNKEISIKKLDEIDDKKVIQVNVSETKKKEAVINVAHTVAEQKSELTVPPIAVNSNTKPMTNTSSVQCSEEQINTSAKVLDLAEIPKHSTDPCNFPKPLENNVINVPNVFPANVDKFVRSYQDKPANVTEVNTITSDTLIAKDLSSNSDNKTSKSNQPRMPYKPFEDNYFMRRGGLPYSDMLVQQSNRLLHSNYRPPFDNYSQEHANNSWFLPKTDEITPAHKALLEARQRYNDLRMPRLDTLPMNQNADYRNFNHGNRIDTTHANQRQEMTPQIPLQQREIPNDRKYYYDTPNMVTDRSKYGQHLNQNLDMSIPRQPNRDFHQNPNQNYSQSPRDLSNSSHSDSQSPHYLQHTFSSPHFFPNFRDLQQRMLNVDYGHPRHLPGLTGMDMTNQRLNPASPLSPYNLDNMSPISRNSYEEVSNHHAPAAHGYHPNSHLLNRTNIRNNGEPLSNSSDKDAGNGDQVGSGGPYEMKVAAN